VLTPTYIAIPPKNDGWGRFLLYNTQCSGDNNCGSYNIISYGRDGVADRTLNCGTTTNFNDDIVFSNGNFLQWPEGTQLAPVEAIHRGHHGHGSGGDGR
jgi:hypothetical protein